MKSRPFPRKCFRCREKTVNRVTERRTVETTFDGKRYSLDIPDYPVNRCSKCGEQTIDNDADDATNYALSALVGEPVGGCDAKAQEGKP